MTGAEAKAELPGDLVAQSMGLALEKLCAPFNVYAEIRSAGRLSRRLLSEDDPWLRLQHSATVSCPFSTWGVVAYRWQRDDWTWLLVRDQGELRVGDWVKLVRVEGATR